MKYIAEYRFRIDIEADSQKEAQKIADIHEDNMDDHWLVSVERFEPDMADLKCDRCLKAQGLEGGCEELNVLSEDYCEDFLMDFDSE